MRILSKVETTAADAVILVELAKAGIPAYSGKILSLSEASASTFGYIQYAGGAMATFIRDWYFWRVDLSHAVPYKLAKPLNNRLGSTVRVGGMSGGAEPTSLGVYKYNVDEQDGLNELVKTLHEAFGTTIDVHQPDVCMPLWLNSGSARPVVHPKQGAAMQRAEVAALRNLSGCIEDYQARESALEDALHLAETFFGEKDEDTQSLQVAVNALYCQQCRHLSKEAASAPCANGRYVRTAEWEVILTKRIALLEKMGRRAKASSLRGECFRLRKTLTEIYWQRLAAEKKELHQASETKSGMEGYWHHCLAFTTKRMMELYQRMGDIAQAKTLDVELAILMRSLTKRQIIELTCKGFF